MSLGFKKGSDDVIREVFIVDSTTGLAKAGLAWDDAGAIASYNLPGGARVAIPLATQTVTGVHSDGGFVEIDATNKKGHYRFDVPNAAFTGADYTNWQLTFPNAHIRPVADALPTNTPTDNFNIVNSGIFGNAQLEKMLVSKQGAISDVSPTASGFDTDLTEADGFFNDHAIRMTSGTQKGLVVGVKENGGYLSAGGAVILDPALNAAPADGDTFAILPWRFSALMSRVLAEPSAGVPPVNPTLQQALAYIYLKDVRSLTQTTASTYTIFNDAGVALFKFSISDDGTTFIRAEAVTP